MSYLCPVCGYPELARPPLDDTICPCCGTHFGYHDFSFTHDELRARWIERGARWFSRTQPAPSLWNPFVQLAAARMASFEAHGGKEESRTQTAVPVNAEFTWANAA